MTTYADASKIVQYVAIGSDSDEASVSKLVMYVLLTPSPSASTPAEKQAHVYVQIIGN